MAVAWWQRIDLSEAHGLVLFWVIREGIGISRRPSVHDTVCGPTGDMDAHSRTRVSQADRPPLDENHQRWNRALYRDAQAACGFTLSASKFSPFFHTVNVMAAIFRASVSRTMVGLMPLATERW